MKKLFFVLALSWVLLLASCHSSYKLTKVEGKVITVDSVWDVHPDAEAVALLAPYKATVDSMMYDVIGTSERTMDRGRPESLLSNLVADVLKESATQVLGKPADMGLVNVGGLRTLLSEGKITRGNIYEILPFENSLCVVTVKGSTLKELFVAIASKRGEGVSGVRLIITKDGQLLEAHLNGKEVEDDQLYTIATIDYIADGNDGMAPLRQGVKRECPEGIILRDIFIHYVERQTQAGNKITSQLDGRVSIAE